MVNILIVEDEGLTALDLKNQLIKSGYNVDDIVSSGEDAITKAIQLKPDLILMDIMLKGEINGIKAAEAINKVLDIPIIYITAYGNEKILEKAKNTAPYAYILKPFNEKEVQYAIEIALHKHKLDSQVIKDKERFKLLYEEAPLPYHSLDQEWKIIEINQAWTDAVGYPYEEVINQPFNQFISLRDRNKFIKYSEDLKDEENSKINLNITKKDGSELTVKYECRPIKNEENEVINTQCIFYEIKKEDLKEKDLQKILDTKEMLLEEIKHHLERESEDISNLVNQSLEDKR